MRDQLRWALLLLVTTGAPALAQPQWPTEGWNPKPDPADLVVPLPCGGAMAFRAVGTPMAAGALADRPAMLGQPDADTDYSEYLRQSFVAGPFRGQAGQSVGFMGKYEVTRDQYAAVMAETCPALPTPAGRLPQAEVSWTEAVTFTTRLSSWALKNAKAALPVADDAVAFIRLPTEVEWEYAARGGDAVSEAEFGARLPPMPDGLVAHAWFGGARSAAGRARPVGLLAPNALGLYDMLGNVSEWVLEPYHLNKVGRPHGRVGGLVARGGDFQTPETQVRSSQRVELPPFRASNGDPLRLPSVGFRVALGAMATSSDARTVALHEAFGAESQMQTSAAEDPVRLLARLRNEASDPVLQGGLQRIEQTLRESVRLQVEREGLALRALISAAAAVARQVRFSQASQFYLSNLAGKLGDYAVFVPDPGIRNILAKDQNSLQTNVDMIVVSRRQLIAFYLLLVNRAAPLATPERLADMGRVVVEEMRAQRVQTMPEAAAKATQHIVLAAQGRLPPPDQVERELLALAPETVAPTQVSPPRIAPTPMTPAGPRR